MPGPRPLRITLTPLQQSLLEQVVRRPTSPQGLVHRAQIILAAAKGANNAQIAQALDLTRGTVRRWRARWREACPALDAAEAAGESEPSLRALLETILADEPRSGAPATFTPEQLVQIVALACEAPADSGRPVTHWTPRELAEEAVRRGIVVSISPRSVGRFLKGGGLEAASQSLLVDVDPGGSGRLCRGGGNGL